MEEIVEVIHRYVLNNFLPSAAPGELKDQTPLITGGVLDSIATLKLVTFIESHFQILFEADEARADRLDTIRRIAEMVAAKRKAAGSACAVGSAGAIA
jgi:acyl carrier protein